MCRMGSVVFTLPTKYIPTCEAKYFVATSFPRYHDVSSTEANIK